MGIERIKRVERLKDQGSGGSLSYEFSTVIAIMKMVMPSVGTNNRSVTHWCNPSKAPPA